MSSTWSWLQPIERRALTAVTHHRYHHRLEVPAVTPLAQLIDDIEHDIQHAAGNVDTHVHDALTRRLTLVTVAGYVADAVARLAASPLAPVLESAAGLPLDSQGILARMAGGLAAELSHQAQLQPAPEKAATA